MASIDAADDPHSGQPILQRGASLADARGVVILLHGRGASAEDILGLSDEIDRAGLSLLAPQAFGRAWYPESFLAPVAGNEPFLSSALGVVAGLVEHAVSAGVPLDRIAICGFSQGACLATEYVARHAARYGGLIALTGGLIGTDEEVSVGTRRSTLSLHGTRVFLGSGDPDPYIPWQRVVDSASVLSAMHAEVTVRRYAGRPHTVSRDEMQHADALLEDMLGGNSAP